MKRRYVLVISIIFLFFIIGLILPLSFSASLIDKKIENYSIKEFKDFNKTYPLGDILTKQRIIYGNGKNEINIEIIEYSSNEVLVKNIQYALSKGLEERFYQNFSYFTYNQSYLWISENYLIQITGLKNFTYNDMLLKVISNEYPPEVPELFIQKNIIVASDLEVMSAKCSDYGWDSCSSSSDEKIVGNTRYECNYIGIIGLSALCWEPVAYNGDDDFCTSLALCSYGQWDCDYDNQCLSNLDCVDYDGGICLFGFECGCCNVGEKWNDATNTCQQIINPLITSAYWTPTTANTGNTVSLNIQTQDISDGQSVEFEIREDDGLLGSDYVTKLYGTINNNFASVNWNVLNGNDQSGNLEYYFISKVAGKLKTSLNLNTLFGYEGWDCDGSPQCALSLTCDGNTPITDTDNEGCCYSYENWNDPAKKCNKAVQGKVYQVYQQGQTFSESPYSNLKLRVFYEDVDLIENDILGYFDVYTNSNGEFKFNPERYVSWWNTPTLFIDYKIYAIYAIDSNEIIGKWTNHFSNEPNFNNADDWVNQIVRIHKDKTAWKKNYFPELDTTSVMSNRKALSASGVSSLEDYVYLKWRGFLQVDNLGEYSLLFNVSDYAKVILNNETVIDTDNYKLNSKLINFTLKDYNNTLEFEIKEKASNIPRMYFASAGNNLTEINDTNLIKIETRVTFLTSQTQKFSVQSVESIVNNNGDYMISFLDVPKAVRNQNPLIFVHGKHGESGYWNGEKIQKYFSEKGYDAWEFYYSGEDDIPVSGTLLGDSISYLKNHYYGSSQKFDIVAHSMGGLVSRSYIQNISSYSYKNNVNHLILLAPPNHGSAASNGITEDWKIDLFNMDYWRIEEVRLNPSILIDEIKLHPEVWISLDLVLDIIQFNYVEILFNILITEVYENKNDLIQKFNTMDKDGTNSPIYRQMSLGSDLVFLFYNKPITPKSLVIIGNKNSLDISGFNSFLCSIADNLGHSESDSSEHDCLVSITSASLLDFNASLSVINGYNHATEVSKLESYSQIILDFLNDKSDSVLASNSYSYYNPKTGYSKSFFNKYSEGSVQIKLMQNGGLWNSQSNSNIQIEKVSSGNIFNLSRNPYSKNYYHFNKYSDQIDSYYTLPKGEYMIIIPNILDYQELHFNIKPMETTFKIIDLCFPNLVNTSWSDWQNISCLPNNLTNQSSYRIQYDSNNCGIVANQTFYDYRAVLPCRNQSNNETDDIYNPLIYNPKEGDIFNERKILVNVSVGKKVKYIKYQIDGKVSRNNEPIYVTLCKDCNKIEKYITFLDGNHTLGIVTINEDNRQFEDSVSFFIDSTYPKIIINSPKKNSYINKSSLFSLEWKENNPSWVDLYLNNNLISGVSLSGSGKVSLGYVGGLDQFNDAELTYYFILRDIVNNTAQSKPVKVYVDTSPPKIINNDFWSVDGQNIYLNINIDEKNLDSVDYKDMNDNTRSQKWKTVCSRLKDNICNKKITYKGTSPNMKIRVVDKAGNSIEKNLVI